MGRSEAQVHPRRFPNAAGTLWTEVAGLEADCHEIQKVTSLIDSLRTQR
jgi:hypothetical protein